MKENNKKTKKNSNQYTTNYVKYQQIPMSFQNFDSQLHDRNEENTEPENSYFELLKKQGHKNINQNNINYYLNQISNIKQQQKSKNNTNSCHVSKQCLNVKKNQSILQLLSFITLEIEQREKKQSKSAIIQVYQQQYFTIKIGIESSIKSLSWILYIKQQKQVLRTLFQIQWSKITKIYIKESQKKFILLMLCFFIARLIKLCQLRIKVVIFIYLRVQVIYFAKEMYLQVFLIFSSKPIQIILQIEVYIQTNMINLRCKTHPSQNITNFCSRQQCLVQLCATCICSHTDMHGINGTLPHYQNIQQTYKRAQQSIDIQKAIIQKEKLRIIAYNKAWDKKKQYIYQRIQNTKKDVLQLVQKTFQELKHRYTQSVHEEQIKIGMKNGDKVMKMLEAHTSQSQKLLNAQKDLIANRGSENVRILFTNLIPETDDLINKIRNDFKGLQIHDMKLQYEKNNLLGLRQKINDLLTLKIQYPQNIVRTPLIQIIETIPQTSYVTQEPFYNSCTSTFYRRPQSVGNPIPGSVTYVNGNSQILVEHKPKISVISGRRGENAKMGNRIVLRNSRRNIFPVPVVKQMIR